MEGDLRRYEQVTADDVWRVYEKYIKDKPKVILSIVPAGMKEAAIEPDNFVPPEAEKTFDEFPYHGRPRKIRDRFARSERPESQALPDVEAPAMWKEELTPHIPVWGVQQSELPLVCIRLRFEAGRDFATRDKRMAVSLLAGMLSYRTQNHPAEELSSLLQRLGSEITFDDTSEEFTLEIQSTKENLEATLAIVNDQIFNPFFDEAAFQRYKPGLIHNFEEDKTSPRSKAEWAMDTILYGQDHVRGMTLSEAQNNLRTVILSDVVDFYHGVFLQNGLQVFVAGDITADEALASLAFLRAWRGTSRPTPSPPEPAMQQTGTKIYLVDHPDAEQTIIEASYLHGMRWTYNGASQRLFVTNKSLGGNSAGRLFKKLRTGKKYTYGAHSRFNFDDDEMGSFTASTSVGRSATAAAIRDLMQEISTFSREGPSEEEFASSIQSTILSKALGREGLSSYLDYVQGLFENKLPDTYLAEQVQMLSAMTLAEAQGLARDYYPAERMAIVVVGDKGAILEDLKTLGYPIDVVNIDAEVLASYPVIDSQ